LSFRSDHVLCTLYLLLITVDAACILTLFQSGFACHMCSNVYSLPIEELPKPSANVTLAEPS
jgi:hypothetical protein